MIRGRSSVENLPRKLIGTNRAARVEELKKPGIPGFVVA
jgi:hypothetical protein